MDISSFWALLAVFASIRSFIPGQWYQFLSSFLDKYFAKFYLYHYVHINREEETINDLYASAELYAGILTIKACTPMVDASCASRISKIISYTLSSNSEVHDSYNGVQIRWTKYVEQTRGGTIRRYTLSVLRRFKDRVLPMYLHHVLEQGRLAQLQKTQKYLYTNIDGRWISHTYNPPATMDSIAMEPHKKETLISDLNAFMNGREFFGRVGRAWKRGYLLYGPPGTGKSSLIGAISNFTSYDVYDLELTMVSHNSSLRKLLMDVNNKAIVVIEDIDCSLPLEDRAQEGGKIVERNNLSSSSSKVTLSGMLNFLDGLWSSNGGERIFVFTTNYVDKLDPALTRAGRMDMHIHMSFCTFPMFKTLASNYLRSDEHHLFAKVEELLALVQVSAAQISEVLVRHYHNPQLALEDLIQMLECIQKPIPKRILTKRISKEEFASIESMCLGNDLPNIIPNK